MALALQRWDEFGFGFFLRLRGDGAEQADFVLAQQIDGALGQRIAFVAPALPANVGVHVVGLEADRVEHANRLGQNLVSNAVSRHGYDRMFCHECKLPIEALEWALLHPSQQAIRILSSRA